MEFFFGPDMYYWTLTKEEYDSLDDSIKTGCAFCWNAWAVEDATQFFTATPKTECHGVGTRISEQEARELVHSWGRQKMGLGEVIEG